MILSANLLSIYQLTFELMQTTYRPMKVYPKNAECIVMLEPDTPELFHSDALI